MPQGSSHERLSQTEQRDRDFYRQIGSIGGKNVKDRYGAEYFSRIGKKGGAATKALYGTEHYQAMGKRGAMVRRHKG